MGKANGVKELKHKIVTSMKESTKMIKSLVLGLSRGSRATFTTGVTKMMSDMATARCNGLMAARIKVNGFPEYNTELAKCLSQMAG